MKIYTSQELTDERYHSEEFPQASGSILYEINATCPAQWRYGEKKQTAAMQSGTWSHCAILEPEVFYEKYTRGLSEIEHPDALHTVKDLDAWLKNAGIKGKSGMSKQEIIDLILSAEPDVKIWDTMQDKFLKDCDEKKIEIIPAKTYDKIVLMRDALFDEGYLELLSGGDFELSIIDDDENLKCRVDALKTTAIGELSIIDYKTTTNTHPEFFGAQALKLGYWLKMALQHDIVEKMTGAKVKVILLAQSKTPPYIAQAYEMTEQQLAVGREQYHKAHEVFNSCIDSGVWPRYGGGIATLETPSWAAYQLGFEGTIEIVEE